MSHFTSQVSRQLTLNQALRAVPRAVDPFDLQPTPREQVLPVLPRALPAAEEGQHHDIQTGGLPVGAGVRDDVLVDEDLAVAGLHGGGDVGEDLEARLVGPIVEDGVHEVGAGACLGQVSQR